MAQLGRLQLIQKIQPLLAGPKSAYGKCDAAGCLFDGRPVADARSFYATLAAEPKLLTIPADSTESAKLARHYINASLGEITVSTSGTSTIFDFGEWKSEVASRKNPDGTVSFITIVLGVTGSEFVVGSGPNRTLIVRDAQHEYVYAER